MRSIYTLLLICVISTATQAQVQFQLAPALNVGGIAYKGSGISSDGVLYAVGGRLRFIGDYKRLQFGFGADVNSMDLSLQSFSASTFDPELSATFINPQFFFDYKFPFKQSNDYLYAGLAIGAGIATVGEWSKPTNGLTGIDIGAVFSLSKKLDIEVTESARVLNGTLSSYYVTNPAIANSNIYTYILTTNIGIRLKRNTH